MPGGRADASCRFAEMSFVVCPSCGHPASHSTVVRVSSGSVRCRDCRQCVGEMIDLAEHDAVEMLASDWDGASVLLRDAGFVAAADLAASANTRRRDPMIALVPLTAILLERLWRDPGRSSRPLGRHDEEGWR